MEETALGAVLTLVIWMGCLAVGVLGLWISYARPRPVATPLPPVQARMVNVEIASVPLSPPEVAPSLPTPAMPSAAPSPVWIPEAPPLVAVAAPSTALAFALPVEGPTRVVAPAQAAYVRPPAAVPSAPPSAQPLVFGQGEGRQPAPEYPRAASRAGQEGVVRVGFTVDAHGRVETAAIAAPSPWPLLDEAALKTVRQRWRFPPGGFRRYEVSIRFQLEK